MAVYTQDWSAGNSLFTSMDVYERATNGVDPLYPEIKEAEGVTITGGKLDWSGYGDYQGAGIFLNGFPTFNGTEASITTTYRPNLTSLGVLFYDPVTQINPITMGSPIELAVQGSGSSGGPWQVRLICRGWGFGNETDQQVDYVFVPDTDYTFKVCWKCGTVVGAFDDVDADGHVRIYINDVLVLSQESFAVFLDYNNDNEVIDLWLGYFGLLGSLDNIIFSDVACDAATSVVPPNMNRASYLFFSNEIVEKQVQTRLTRTFVQLLATDSPAATSSIGLTLTEVTGNIYDSNGVLMTSGRLTIKPRAMITVDNIYLFGTETITYDVTGPVSINLAPSSTVTYTVIFDPDPSDPRPANPKLGYWTNIWTVPDVTSVDISEL